MSEHNPALPAPPGALPLAPAPAPDEPVTWFAVGEGESVRLGSLVTHGLCLDDPELAPLHALVEARDGLLWLVDLHQGYSATQLNGAWVEREVVADGDVVALGATVLRVHTEDDPMHPTRPGERLLGLEIVRTVEAHDPAPMPWDGSSDLEFYTARFMRARARDQGDAHDTLELAMLWRDHLVTTRVFPAEEGRVVCVGGDASDPENALIFEHPRGRLPLVRCVGGVWHLTLTPAQRGHVLEGGEAIALATARAHHDASIYLDVEDALSLPLTHTRHAARLDFGEVTVLARVGPRPARFTGGFASGAVDRAPVPYLTTSAALHWLFMLCVLIIPPGVHTALDMEEFVEVDRLVRVDLTVRPVQPLTRAHDLEGDGRDAALGATHRDEEGRAGDAASTLEELRKMAAASDIPTIHRVRRRARTRRAQEPRVTRAARRRLLPGAMMPDLSSVTTLTASAVGAQVEEALGQVKDARTGTSHGMGGMGLTGAGRGAGGSLAETLGLTATPRRGAIQLGGQGVTRDRRAPDAARVFDMIMTRGDAKGNTGCLTPDMIRAAIRRRRNQLRACYEHDLQLRRTLRGRLDVSLEIAPSGRVRRVDILKSTFPRDTSVARCVRQHLATLAFPTFDQCEVVRVRHPFNFDMRRAPAR